MNNSYLNTQNIEALTGKRLRLRYSDGIEIEIIPKSTTTETSNQIGQDTHLQLTFDEFEKNADCYVKGNQQVEKLSDQFIEPEKRTDLRVMDADELRHNFDRPYRVMSAIDPQYSVMKTLHLMDTEEGSELWYYWSKSPTYGEFVDGATFVSGQWKFNGQKDYIYEWGGYFRVTGSAHMLEIICIDGEPYQPDKAKGNDSMIFDTSRGLSAAIAEMELAWKDLDIAILPNLEMVRFLEDEEVSLIRFAGNTPVGSKYEIESTDGITYFIEINEVDGSFTELRSQFTI